MPTLPQIIHQAEIYTKAQLSISTESPTDLWYTPSKKDIFYINSQDLFDSYKLFLLNFIITSDDRKKKVAGSFFFVDPRWQHTPPLDFTLNFLFAGEFKFNLLSKTHGKIYWQFFKQNDIDLWRLITSRISQKKRFYLPFSKFLLTPLGVTPPILTVRESPTSYALDLTSFTQKLCYSNGFLTHRQIFLSWVTR